MEFIETKLKGAFEVRLKKLADHRGYFARGWCREEFAKHGLNPNMLQLNTGFSHKAGTLRGMHFQGAPHAEAKFIRCTRGAIYDVIIDLRPDSPTHRQWVGAELTPDNDSMLYAPEGFAHGYQTLTDDADMYYMTTALYASGAAAGVRHDDPAFGIQWPLPVSVIWSRIEIGPTIGFEVRGDSMKKVLLTGASGFIGQHCVGPLLARGYEVHAVSSQPRPGVDQGIHWHQANLLETGSAKALMSEIKPSHLLHLAWFVVPGKLITALENFAWVRASMELVQQFGEQGGKRLTVCGSGYEYDWNYGYCSETLTAAVPNTVYGACKQALNLLVQAFASQRELSSAWGRVFFLYGPNEHPQRLVSSVILALLKREPAKCSHGRQIRDYMHVQDVADGLVGLLDSQVTGAVNVSSGQATTLREIVLTIGRILERPELLQLGAIPARANDAPLVVGQNQRLVHEVGWKQQYELEAGLRQTIEWWAARK